MNTRNSVSKQSGAKPLYLYCPLVQLLRQLVSRTLESKSVREPTMTRREGRMW